MQDKPRLEMDDSVPLPSRVFSATGRDRRIRRFLPWIIATCLVVTAGGAFLFWQHINAPVAKVSRSSPTGNARLDSDITKLPGLPDEALPTETSSALKVTAEEAVKINQSIPEISERITSAKPFRVPSGAAAQLSRSSAINCLTSAIYYEAATESEEGQRAVAQVVLNRVRHPAYPKSICGVVFQGSERTTGCQFSFTCDGSMARVPNPAIWNRAKRYATEAISGTVEPSVGNATHYHTIWIVPYWAKSLVKLRTVGAHIFYRWPGYWGQPGAFKGRYAGEDLSAAVPEQADTDIAIEYETDMESDADTVTFTRKEDPILAPQFKLEPPKPVAPQKSRITADENTGALAADKNKGTLIDR